MSNREEFERLLKEQSPNAVLTFVNGEYIVPRVQHKWEGYQMRLNKNEEQPVQKSLNSTTEAIMDEIGEHRPANPDSPFTLLIDQTVLRDILDSVFTRDVESLRKENAALKAENERLRKIVNEAHGIVC